MKNTAFDEHKRHVRRKAQQYDEVFGSPVGKEVLADLQATYVDVDLFDSDPLKMAAKVGQRDVIARILDLMRVAQHERDD